MPNFHQLSSGAITSIDPRKPGNRKAIYLALMGEAMEAQEVFNVDIPVSDIILKPTGKDMADGERQEWVTVLLILANGDRVRFGSRGVLQSLATYCECFASPPWIPPAVFRLRATNMDGGKHFYELVAVDTEMPAIIPTKKR